MTAILVGILGLVAAFLVGALPFSYWVARLFRGVDIRTVGSGNAGATNVFRTQGKRLGSLALALDMLKGLVAVLALRSFGTALPMDGFLYAALLGVAAILGHTFTPFLGWRGGKGVATSAGVFAALLPAAFAAALLIFVIVFLISRIISVSSLVAAAVLPGLVWVFARSSSELPYAMLLGLTVSVFIFWTHRANIARLARGEEKVMFEYKKNIDKKS